MKTVFSFTICTVALLMTSSSMGANPFLSDWGTPFGVPDFEAIQVDHYQPAFEEGMKRLAAVFKEALQ